MTLLERMLAWVDAEECRTLTLVNANPDFDGPEHLMEYSTIQQPTKQVFGRTREEIMTKIENETR